MNTLIADLINKKIETANLDCKEGFEWTRDSRDKRFELIDILAMANTRDGGTIILGVKDDTRELVGVSKEICDSVDQSSVSKMVHRYGKPKVNLQVIKTKVHAKVVVGLTIAEFEDVPIICTDTITEVLNTSRPILRKSAVYIRTSAATTECKNRQLASFGESRRLRSDFYESQEDVISFQREYTVEELRASSNEIAGTIMKHIFHVFNCTDITDEAIALWQHKLLTRS